MNGGTRNLIEIYRFREAVVMLAGLALLMLSVPRLWAYGTALPEDGQYWRLGQGEQLSDRELADLSVTYAVAADRFPSSPELQGRAAVALVEYGLRQLETEPIREGRERLLHAASRAPLRTDLWSRLAYVEFAAAGMSPLAVDALKLSWLTGRLELPDALRRLQVYLSGWDDLPSDAQQDAEAQLGLLWRARHVVRIAELYVTLSPKEQNLLKSILPNPKADAHMLDHRVSRLPSHSR